MSNPLPTALDDSLSEKIRDLCQQGYKHYDQADYKLAIRQFYRAWTLIPKPQQQWPEAGWVLTALGDAYFKTENYSSSIEALKSALHCPKTDKHPFIHLRLGQSYYESYKLSQTESDKENSFSALTIAFNEGGEQLFAKEHPSYLSSLTPSPVT